MTPASRPPDKARNRLGRALLLTRWGMVAERAIRAFWPLWSLCLAGLAPVLMGLQDVVAPEIIRAGVALWALAVVGAGIFGARRFRWPTRAEAGARLDQSLPGRPLAAIGDTQAIGARDAASRAVWQAHRARMRARLARARAVAPDLRISTRDRFGLRYMALLAFSVALLFGTLGRVADVATLLPGQGGVALAAGPSWEGWVAPPAYTGKPGLYLNDLIGKPLDVPVGSRITLRLYGGDANRISETISGQSAPPVPDATGATSFAVAQSGDLAISGAKGARWSLTALPDQAPIVRLDGPMKRQARGRMSQPFAAQDDYGVVAGQATFSLDLAQLDRRYGLAAAPDARPPIILDLPLPISRNHADFSENLVDDLSKHPWSGLAVTMVLQVTDARGQSGRSEPTKLSLPGRRFFDPLAAAVIEQRRDLLWARTNGARVAQVLRALLTRPEGFVRNESGYLMARLAIRRLEAGVAAGLNAAVQTEVADALWQVAVLFEDGALSDARQRMQRAQERLSEAMKNGASDAEIADLMQELRDATKDYMRQLAEQQDQNSDQQSAQNQQTQEITQEQIQALMDRIQQLMEQGRMAEAQQLMEQFNQMMQNLRVTRNQQGGGGQNSGQNPGQQAMGGLKDTLRRQQGLSDQAFRDLQEQFNPRGDPGQNQDQNGGQQQGQGGGQGDTRQPDQKSGQQPGQPQDLAGRQQALRDQLRRQQGNLPGAATPEGKAAREALGRANEAMTGAEQALRNNDLAEALTRQADAMEALREGMRNLGEALAQQQQRQPGQQGQAQGRANARGRDPLGRESGDRGRIGTDQNLLQGKDIYRRARDLLDELRRRSGDRARPRIERDYLKRLLEQF